MLAGNMLRAYGAKNIYPCTPGGTYPDVRKFPFGSPPAAAAPPIPSGTYECTEICPYWDNLLPLLQLQLWTPTDCLCSNTTGFSPRISK
jgi:hypothetical protein